VSRRRLVLASKNAGKIREMQSLLADAAVEVVGLDPTAEEVAETGTTFEENALIKARAACAATGIAALGEDSGLAVDALGGEPGIYSARWAPGSDADRLQALLERMAAIPDGERSGQYVSCIALVTPDGAEVVVRGELAGEILRAPRGTGGFGYDPIFGLPGGKSTAELSLAEKNAISHRGRALTQLRMALLGLLKG
jgi:XTP/dITP diphosphohydrolase